MQFILPNCKILGVRLREGRNENGDYHYVQAKLEQGNGFDTEQKICKFIDDETFERFENLLAELKLADYPRMNLVIELTEYQSKSYFAIVDYIASAVGEGTELEQLLKKNRDEKKK